MTTTTEAAFPRQSRVRRLRTALVAPFVVPFMYGRPFLNTLRYEVAQRLAGTVLGYAWLVLVPAFFLGFYSITYIVIFRIQPPGLSTIEYTLFIFCGLMPFLGFAEGVSAGASSLRGSRNLLFNTVFPVELITMRRVLSTQTTFYFGIALAIIATIISKGVISPSLLIVPYIAFATTLFILGVSYMLALLALVVKDVQEGLRFLILMLMLISPIAYTREMVPDVLRLMIFLNPLSYFIICFQDAAVLGTWPPFYALLLSTILGFGTYVLGFNFFSRLKSVYIERA